MTRKQKLIRQIMVIAGDHQPTAAELLGVRQPSICRYLAGSPVRKSVVLLARRIVIEAGLRPAG